MKGQKRSKVKASDVKKMPKSFLKALAQYKKEIKKLPKNNPEKGLAKGWPLISAILEGEGELRVVQTVVIQKLLEIDKKNFMIPKFGPQGFEFKGQEEGQTPLGHDRHKMKHTKIIPHQAQERASPGSKDNVVVTVDGKHNDSHDFLTGWTLTRF